MAKEIQWGDRINPDIVPVDESDELKTSYEDVAMMMGIIVNDYTFIRNELTSNNVLIQLMLKELDKSKQDIISKQREIIMSVLNTVNNWLAGNNGKFSPRTSLTDEEVDVLIHPAIMAGVDEDIIRTLVAKEIKISQGNNY